MRIAGVDEAGRGPLAGPVVAAAVVLPEGYLNQEITDSKKLSAKKRDILFEAITKNALSYSIVCVGHHRIDQLNIREATRVAMKLAVRRVKAEKALIDGNVPIEIDIPQETVIGGDRLHQEISAASILAKVWRDRLMKCLDLKYPGYGLADHAGYPTKKHKEAIELIGPSKIHRKTFRGVKEFIQKDGLSKASNW
ncbi:MAG: ribonuclease HII [Deltaproteobacteria bacterium]|nr:ribonuclease HII [Deltaproteobacteria bacterium]